MKMYRPYPIAAWALAASVAVASLPLAAAPIEAPMRGATGTLTYEIEMTGLRGGKPVRHRLVARAPVSSRDSGPLNLLGTSFTQSQQREIDAMASATSGHADGEAAMMDASEALNEMLDACLGGESERCASARGRYEAAEAVLSERAADVAGAQSAIGHDDSDDHRFLTFIPGENSHDCGSVEAVYQEGSRTGSGRLGPQDLGACSSMAVLDRRTGEVALQMSPATLKVDDIRVVDLMKLAGTPDVRMGSLHLSVTLPLQPTLATGSDYAGSKIIQAGGMTYKFDWRLALD